MRAVFNNEVIAESDNTIVVENHHYFPPDSVKEAFLIPSNYTSTCPWKGEAHYHNISVLGKTENDAAWYYPDPKPEAQQIKDYIAFWKGVQIVQ